MNKKITGKQRALVWLALMIIPWSVVISVVVVIANYG